MLNLTRSFKKVLKNNEEIEFTWKNTYDSRRIFPADFYECRKVALMFGYSYLEFNGLIYDLHSKDIRKVVGQKSDITIMV